MPLPTPFDLGLPPEAVIAVPVGGLPVYRLIRSETPLASDFEPVSPERAAARRFPEVLRVGLSCYLEVWQAEAVRTRPASRIARVTLRQDSRTHVARTGSRDGHVTIWAPLEELLAAVELAE